MSSSQHDPHNNASIHPNEADQLLGMELGNYRLVERLGEGASAVVYRAEHIRLGIPYAIKILHPIIATRQGMRERFLREAQAAGSLRHENVVFIADFAIDTKIGPYMVMEFLEGETLQSVLEREGALTIERVRNITKQICKALIVAHDIGIIHRDLKPENIFLVQRKGGETAKILDFGIARLAQSTQNLTGAGNIVGTPLYMSPEQCRGEGELTASTDIYSFGVMLFQMLMGYTPFQGDHPQKLLIDHFLVPAPPLSNAFPEALRKLQADLLAKTPEERPPDMETVWRRLSDAISTTSPHHKHEKGAYDDGDEDDYTDLTAAFDPLPDPNSPTVAVRETHGVSDFARLTGRSVDREETDIAQQRPANYHTPLPTGSPRLSIGEHDPNFEYDRQTMESLPAMTPDLMAKQHNPVFVQQNQVSRDLSSPTQLSLEPSTAQNNDDTDGFKQIQQPRELPSSLSSSSLPSSTPSPDTDEELLKDLALYASSPTPASSSAWESTTPPQTAWPNASSGNSSNPWQGDTWSDPNTSPRVHQSDPALDQLLEFSAPQMPEKTSAQTEIHIAATPLEDDAPNVSEMELNFNQYTQTELRAPDFSNYSGSSPHTKQNKKNVFLIVLFLALVGGAGLGLYLLITFFSTPNEVPPPPLNQKHLRLVQSLDAVTVCSPEPKQICVRSFSTKPQTTFYYIPQGSQKRESSEQTKSYCFCSSPNSKAELHATVFGADGKPIKLQSSVHLKQPLLVVFDFDTKQTQSYPAHFARKAQKTLPPLRPTPRKTP
ncbi:MAG: serine/threonine protein kinase [Myxococcales bacterium]|nr:serine/threonine protein kinase [Myxococcales bacterium]